MRCVYCDAELQGRHYNLYLRREAVHKGYHGLEGVSALEDSLDPDPIAMLLEFANRLLGDRRQKAVVVEKGEPFRPHHRLIGMKKGKGAYVYYPAPRAAFLRFQRKQQSSVKWYHLNLFGAMPRIYKLQACAPCFVRRKDRFPAGTYDEDYTQLDIPDDPLMAWGAEEDLPDLQVGRLDMA